VKPIALRRVALPLFALDFALQPPLDLKDLLPAIGERYRVGCSVEVHNPACGKSYHIVLSQPVRSRFVHRSCYVLNRCAAAQHQQGIQKMRGFLAYPTVSKVRDVRN
jgi:hypothetical protein